MELLVGILREAACVTRQRFKSILSSAAHPVSLHFMVKRAGKDPPKKLLKIICWMHSLQGQVGGGGLRLPVYRLEKGGEVLRHTTGPVCVCGRGGGH